MKTLSILSSSLALLVSTNIALATVSDDNKNSVKLDTVLAAQSDEAKARYQYRHPKQTLQFFGIKPGMTVVEALPGGGWYSKILAPYLGSEGELIGVNYPDSLWPNFSWAKEDFIKSRIASTKEFPAKVQEWAPEDTPKAEGYTFATFPKEMTETVDAALYIRALHNLARFNDTDKYLDQALSETHRILKPGGIIGVVQHSAKYKDLTGSGGYLNQAELIATIEQAGFSLVAASDINANPKDQPKPDDIVWRLPPSYYSSGEDEKMKETFRAVGESNRMTLLFKKK